MEKQHERQEVVRHVSNSHSSLKQADPELERLKQEIAEARAKQEQRQETTGNISDSDSYLRQSDLEIERLQQEVAEARAKQIRELDRARPEVEEDLEHEGVKCHVCGWQGVGFRV
jgi:DNA repair exonuclease SbcCD ATPase subunit